MIENSPADPRCGIRILLCDVSANLPQIGNCRVRPNYLIVHALAQDSINCSAC